MAYQDLTITYSTTPDEAFGQQVNDNFAYLAVQRPQININIASQNVHDNTPTTLSQGLTGSNVIWGPANSRLTISDAAYDGIYLVTARIIFQNIKTGNDRRYLRLAKNGTTYLATRQGTRGLNGDFDTTITTLAKLQEDDYVTVVAYQDEGTDSFLCYGSLSAQLVAPIPA